MTIYQPGPSHAQYQSPSSRGKLDIKIDITGNGKVATSILAKVRTTTLEIDKHADTHKAMDSIKNRAARFFGSNVDLKKIDPDYDPGSHSVSAKISTERTLKKTMYQGLKSFFTRSDQGAKQVVSATESIDINSRKTTSRKITINLSDIKEAKAQGQNISLRKVVNDLKRTFPELSKEIDYGKLKALQQKGDEKITIGELSLSDQLAIDLENLGLDRDVVRSLIELMEKEHGSLDGLKLILDQKKNVNIGVVKAYEAELKGLQSQMQDKRLGKSDVLEGLLDKIAYHEIMRSQDSPYVRLVDTTY